MDLNLYIELLEKEVYEQRSELQRQLFELTDLEVRLEGTRQLVITAETEISRLKHKKRPTTKWSEVRKPAGPERQARVADAVEGMKQAATLEGE